MYDYRSSEFYSNLFEDSTQSINTCNPQPGICELAKRLGIEFYVFEHSVPTITASEKYKLLNENKTIIRKALGLSYLTDQSLNFVVYRSVSCTGIASKVYEFSKTIKFILTYPGISNLSHHEKNFIQSSMKNILGISDYSVGLNWGKDSATDLSLMGMVEGSVSPFFSSNDGPIYHNVVMERSIYSNQKYKSGVYLLADFALTNTISLLVNPIHVGRLIKAHCEENNTSIIQLLSHDQTVF